MIEVRGETGSIAREANVKQLFQFLMDILIHSEKK